MTITERHAQALKDVATLKRVCGDVYDHCGAWCNTDVLGDLLKSPTKKNAIFHLETLIERFFSVGVQHGHDNATEEIDTQHPEIRKIAVRYGIE